MVMNIFFMIGVLGLVLYFLTRGWHDILAGKLGGQGYYRQILAPSFQAAYTDSLVRAGGCDTLWAVARRKD